MFLYDESDSGSITAPSVSGFNAADNQRNLHSHSSAEEQVFRIDGKFEISIISSSKSTTCLKVIV